MGHDGDNMLADGLKAGRNVFLSYQACLWADKFFTFTSCRVKAVKGLG